MRIDPKRLATIRQWLANGKPLKELENQFDWEDNRETQRRRTTPQSG